ncbi:MAG TPA: ABC transporter ATP-binding protein [Casimicrobiaceae bacterium]|nr:ABC transporter ATP-binding protein [Casimicrobiaceae bacterium]
MLAIDAIDAYYGETQVLFGVSLDVAEGEIVALLGPNGAGKTTTIRAVLGLTPPRDGRVSFDGQPITGLPTHRIARMGVGWVPDDRRVFPSLTAERNLKIARKRTRFRSYSIDECCEVFPALPHLLPRECENLSGGELQMVSISRALVGAPGLVLFDEPSQGLAPKVAQDVLATIVKLKAAGVASLVVDQNMRSVLEIADRVYVMQLGRIVKSAPAAALRDDATMRRQWLGLN